jgi:hypothetical protein
VDRDKLRAAVEADVISAEQAAKLEAMAVGGRDDVSEGEPLRFLSNLNDVFLAIGIVILFFGLSIALSILFFGQITSKTYAPGVMIPLAITAWAMAEYFCRRRRMLLPGIVLAALWTFFVGMSVLALLAWGVVENEGTGLLGSIFNDQGDTGNVTRNIADGARNSTLLAIAASFIAALSFYIRFRLPFTQFLMAACVALAVMTLVPASATLLGTGILTLCAAIYFDARDPDRISRLSDNAFWLHVAAAPQIVYGLRGVLEQTIGSDTMTINISLITLLAALALLSLAVNRRALIISGLLTFGWAVWSLFQVFGDSLLMRIAGPLLLIGGLIVLLGSGWRTARRFLLVLLPSNGVFARIFPPEPRLND